MKRVTSILTLSLILFSNAPARAQKGKGGGGEAEALRNGWIYSLAEGKAQAAKANKPLMVVMRCVP